MSALLALPIFVIILIAIGALAIHFLPTIVAATRHVQNLWWIVLINVFFGWTLIGWVAALVWAATDAPRLRGFIAPPPPYNR